MDRRVVEESFLEALVQSLRDSLPNAILISANEGQLRMEGAARVTTIHVYELLKQDDELLENMETAATAVLSRVQDLVSQQMKTPWPGSSNELPLPHAEWSGDSLRLWYGTASKPVLELLPLKLGGTVGT